MLVKRLLKNTEKNIFIKKKILKKRFDKKLNNDSFNNK